VVSHVLTCGKGSTALQVEALTTFAPIYRAGSHLTPLELRLREFRSPLADSELNIQFTEDGRLKSINHNWTGQGEAIVRAGVAALSQMKALQVVGLEIKGVKEKRPSQEETFRNVCSELDRIDPSNHTNKLFSKVVVQHFIEISRDTPIGSPQSLKPVTGREGLIKTLENLGLELKVTVNIKEEAPAPTHKQFALEPGASEDAYGKLTIQEIGSVTITPSHYVSFFTENSENLTNGRFQIPLKSTTNILVPRPQPFGGAKFSMELAESGRVFKIGYSKNSGATGFLNATASGAGAQTTFDTAEAAALKAAADAIAQRLRLQNCIDKPTECK
jgi:hypothetical protein